MQTHLLTLLTPIHQRQLSQPSNHLYQLSRKLLKIISVQVIITNGCQRQKRANSCGILCETNKGKKTGRKEKDKKWSSIGKESQR